MYLLCQAAVANSSGPDILKVRLRDSEGVRPSPVQRNNSSTVLGSDTWLDRQIFAAEGGKTWYPANGQVACTYRAGACTCRAQDRHTA